MFQTHFQKCIVRKPPRFCRRSLRPHQPKALLFSPQSQPSAGSFSLQSIHSAQSSSGCLFLLGWYESGHCLPTFPDSRTAWTTLYVSTCSVDNKAYLSLAGFWQSEQHA